MWLDDQAMKPEMGDALRRVSTGTSSVRGTPDGKSRNSGTVDGWVVYSGEDLPWREDRAQLERTAVLELVKPVQDRVDPDGSPQWNRARHYVGKQAIGFDAATALVIGLNRTAAEMDLNSNPGKRRVAAYQVCLIGARVLHAWLTEFGHGEVADRMLEAAEDWAGVSTAKNEMRHLVGGGQALSDAILPGYLNWAAQQGWWHGGFEIEVPNVDRVSIHEQLDPDVISRNQVAALVVKVDEEYRVVVNIKRLHDWLHDRAGGQTKEYLRDIRSTLTGMQSLNHQARAILGPEKSIVLGSGSKRARYRVVTALSTKWMLNIAAGEH